VVLLEHKDDTMKNLIIIICILMFPACATVSEVPNPVGLYIEKVKADPVNEIIDWWIVLDVLEGTTF
jgi:uncharacterized lipoprotein YajG